MESTYISLDELRYYRNLLTLEVRDRIEWKLSPGSVYGYVKHGVITAIYPEGKGAFIGKHHGFVTVYSPPATYSVHLTNPTLKKLETDK